MKSLCVFCGASPGNNSNHSQAAETLGALMAQSQLRLIYGGSSKGLMGTLASSVLKNGGRVIGVVPDFLLQQEPPRTDLEQLIVVSSMHERKKIMSELADAFVALPGGLGTMDEFYEILTWRQIGLHSKPIGLLNCADFFSPLLKFTEQQIASGLLDPTAWSEVKIATQASAILTSLFPREIPIESQSKLNEEKRVR